MRGLVAPSPQPRPLTFYQKQMRVVDVQRPFPFSELTLLHVSSRRLLRKKAETHSFGLPHHRMQRVKIVNHKYWHPQNAVGTQQLQLPKLKGMHFRKEAV